MNDEILRQKLRHIAIDKQCRCSGCGYEHRCGAEGCAIIRKALERLALEPPKADVAAGLRGGEN